MLLPIKAYAYAIDLDVAVSQSTCSCIKQNAYSTVFIRAYTPTGSGSYDPNAANNVRNCYNAGLGTEVYMTPQPVSGKSAAQQIDELYQGLCSSGISLRSIWIQVTSPINWNLDINANRVFINALLCRAAQYHLGLGIYTNVYDWNQITGAWSNLPFQTSLWYWSVLGNGPQGESPANFDDFRPFGPWGAANVKQFAQAEPVCGIIVNRDIYPIGATIVSQAAVMEEGKVVVGAKIHI